MKSALEAVQGGERAPGWLQEGRRDGGASPTPTQTPAVGFFFFIQPELPCERTQNTKKTTPKKNPTREGKKRRGTQAFRKNKSMGNESEGLRSLWHLPPPRGAGGDRGAWPRSRVGAIRREPGTRSLPRGRPAQSSPDLGTSLEPAGTGLIRAGRGVLRAGGRAGGSLVLRVLRAGDKEVSGGQRRQGSIPRFSCAPAAGTG